MLKVRAAADVSITSSPTPMRANPKTKSRGGNSFLRPVPTITNSGFSRRMAEKSSENLIRSISNSKSITFDKFIYSLGIKEVGITTAQSLAAKYTSIEKLTSASQSELCSINDIGEIVAENLYNYFRNKINQSKINNLVKLGVKIRYTNTISDNKLSGNVYVITGTFKNISRADIDFDNERRFFNKIA